MHIDPQDSISQKELDSVTKANKTIQFQEPPVCVSECTRNIGQPHVFS